MRAETGIRLQVASVDSASFSQLAAQFSIVINVTTCFRKPATCGPTNNQQLDKQTTNNYQLNKNK